MGKGQADAGYRAFISYSHADSQVVEWLHGALEGCRIPAKLVGELTPLGPVPARLGRIFRDRDELPDANGNPNTQITASWNDSGQTQILLDDKDNDNNSYSFKPAIVLTWNNNYFISLDPVIRNGRST